MITRTALGDCYCIGAEPKLGVRHFLFGVLQGRSKFESLGKAALCQAEALNFREGVVTYRRGPNDSKNILVRILK